jgi:hypothetical protein
MIATIIGWYRRLRLTRPKFSRLQYIPTRAAAPATLSPRTLYIVGSENQPKWAVFTCPCGRGHQIDLDLQRGHRPRWRVELNSGRPSVRPSVDVRSAVRCHFLVRRGRVVWVHARDSTLVRPSESMRDD